VPLQLVLIQIEQVLSYFLVLQELAQLFPDSQLLEVEHFPDLFQLSFSKQDFELIPSLLPKLSLLQFLV